MSVFEEYVNNLKAEYQVTEKQQGEFLTIIFTIADSEGLITIAVSGRTAGTPERVTVRAIKAVESKDEYLSKCNDFNSQSTGIIAFVDKNKIVTSCTLVDPTVAKINDMVGKLSVVNSYVRSRKGDR